MLVLGRKPGEYVMIGDDIIVKVIRSDDGDLRLAIDAPKYVNIVRGEIYEARVKYAQENNTAVSLQYPGSSAIVG